MRKHGVVLGLIVLGVAVSVLLAAGRTGSGAAEDHQAGSHGGRRTPEVVASGNSPRSWLPSRKGPCGPMSWRRPGRRERDIVEGQQIGSLQMSVVSGIIQNFDPAMMILEYEFLFKNEDHVRKVMNGPIGEQINKRLAEKAKLRYLSVFMRTPRILTTSKPVNKVGDLKA